MGAPEGVIYLSGTMMARLMKPAAIVRDTSPRISSPINRRRAPTPLETHRPVIPIRLEEVTTEVVRQDPVTTPPAVTEAATIRMAATKEVVTVAEVIGVKATARKAIISTTMTKPTGLRG